MTALLGGLKYSWLKCRKHEKIEKITRSQDDGFAGGSKHSWLGRLKHQRSKKSQALLMTKRRVGVSSGNWFEGSQVSKARPGPSFDFTLRSCRGHMLCHFSPDSQTASLMLLMTQAELDRSGAAPTALGFSSGSI